MTYQKAPLFSCQTHGVFLHNRARNQAFWHPEEKVTRLIGSLKPPPPPASLSVCFKWPFSRFARSRPTRTSPADTHSALLPSLSCILEKRSDPHSAATFRGGGESGVRENTHIVGSAWKENHCHPFVYKTHDFVQDLFVVPCSVDWRYFYASNIHISLAIVTVNRF